MRFLLDEGVPVGVGTALKSAGHEVILFHESGLVKGSPDPAVCAAAEANDAILVGADRDLKTLARGHGVTPARFKKMGLLHFLCASPSAAGRTAAALSLIEHEWSKVAAGECTRFYVVILDAVIRTHR